METVLSSSTETGVSEGGKILIIGGYGQVGRLIAKWLAPLFLARVTIAGRNLDLAREASAEIGQGVEAGVVDISDVEVKTELDGVMLVIVCLDQADIRFAEECLSRGIHYVDISADYDFLYKVENLDSLAKRSGAAAILSVGVAPGLTNMLAARAKDQMERVDRIDIVLEIGLGDHHGQAAVEWMFDNLDAEYVVKENGRSKSVQSFGERISISLPGQRTDHPAYRFNFSDQRVIGRTLDVPSVSTWVRFDNRVATWLFARASQAGLGRLLRRPRWRSVAVWLFMNAHIGSNTCGVAVRAMGKTPQGENTLTLGLIGQKEALMTAIVTAEVARQLLVHNPGPGVHHSEEAIDFDSVVSALEKRLPNLIVAL